MDDIEQLSRRIGAKLKELGKTVAVGESLTAGKVQDAFASVSGSSSYFRGGVTAYNLDAKVRVLGVDFDIAVGCGCVSEQVAIMMARGVAKLLDANIGIGTTGYAEPCDGVETPFAHFAVIVDDRAMANSMVEGPGLSREEMRRLVAYKALEALALLIGA